MNLSASILPILSMILSGMSIRNTKVKWWRAAYFVKASDPATLVKRYGVRFPAETIHRNPRQASQSTLPLYA